MVFWFVVVWRHFSDISWQSVFIGGEFQERTIDLQHAIDNQSTRIWSRAHLQHAGSQLATIMLIRHIDKVVRMLRPLGHRSYISKYRLSWFNCTQIEKIYIQNSKWCLLWKKIICPKRFSEFTIRNTQSRILEDKDF